MHLWDRILACIHTLQLSICLQINTLNTTLGRTFLPWLNSATRRTKHERIWKAIYQMALPNFKFLLWMIWPEKRGAGNNYHLPPVSHNIGRTHISTEAAHQDREQTSQLSCSPAGRIWNPSLNSLLVMIEWGKSKTGFILFIKKKTPN